MPTRCEVCGEGITSPLCPSCVGEEVVTWLAESKPELISAFTLETDDFMRGYGTVRCIKCSGKMNICSHCYVKHIASWLIDADMDTDLMEEYNVFFNSPIIDNYGLFEVRLE